MKFKEWIQIDEARFKGFMRQFMTQHPNVPEYILRQMYYNHMSPGMKSEITPYMNSKDQTVATTPARKTQNPGIRQDPPQAAQALSRFHSTPTEVINQRDMISGVQWFKKPMVVTVTPLDFNTKTLGVFLKWKFGLTPNDKIVRNDSQRFNTQQTLASQRQEGENEPIILVFNGTKYDLLEGYHRTMSYLMSKHDPNQGAPEDQIQYMIQGGDARDLDLSKWKPVKIKGYVGVKRSESQNSPRGPTPGDDQGPTLVTQA